MTKQVLSSTPANPRKRSFKGNHTASPSFIRADSNDNQYKSDSSNFESNENEGFDDKYSDFGSDDEGQLTDDDDDDDEMGVHRGGDDLHLNHKMASNTADVTFEEMSKGPIEVNQDLEGKNDLDCFGDNATIYFNDSMDISELPTMIAQDGFESSHEVKDMDWEYMDAGDTVVDERKKQLPKDYFKKFADEKKELKEDLNTIDDQKFICPVSQIMELFKQVRCSECDAKVEVTKKKLCGSVLEMTYMCAKGHCGRWSSSSLLNKVYAVNLQLACAILLSGSLFVKVSLFFKFMNLGIISSSTFNRVIRLYASPAIETWWMKMQNEIFDILKGSGLIVGGDGRNDSPGHSSTYCQYTFMDTSTNLIVHQELVDVREADHKSPNMEKVGFERGLRYLIRKVEVDGVVTDSHSSITALMGMLNLLLSLHI